MAVRFAEVSDKQHAFSLLQKIKQKKDESVPVFGERVLSLAMQAYDNIDAPEVQRQLVNFFVDGLFHDYVRIKVLREDPGDFQAAVTCGMTEFNFRKRVDLRTGHDFYSNSRFDGQNAVPMEVDHYRPRYKTKRDRYCSNCRRKGHNTNECRYIQVNALQQCDEPPRRDDNPPRGQRGRTTGWTNNRTNRMNGRCYNCGRPGHYARECRANMDGSGN